MTQSFKDKYPELQKWKDAYKDKTGIALHPYAVPHEEVEEDLLLTIKEMQAVIVILDERIVSLEAKLVELSKQKKTIKKKEKEPEEKATEVKEPEEKEPEEKN